MRTSRSIVPSDADTYQGHWRRVCTEADPVRLTARQHRNAVRVVAFNVSEGGSRDASERRNRGPTPLRG
jgi:hypothetical protein